MGRKLQYITVCAVLCAMLMGGCGTVQEKPQSGETTAQTDASDKAGDSTQQEASKQEETSGEQTGEKEEKSEPNDSVSQTPQIDLEHKYDEVWDKAFEGVLARGSFDAVVVSGEGYEALKTSLEAWNQENQESYQMSMDQIKEWAEADSEMWEPPYNGYSVDHSLEITRLDGQILSLLKNCYEYGGGAHGNYWYDAACFDAVSGTRLKLVDLFEDGEGFTAWAKEEGWKRLEKEYGEGMFADAKDTYDAAWAEDPVWYLDARGINLVFSPYDLGPYAMGEARVIYTYEECAAWIKPVYGAIPASGIAELPLETEVSLPLGESGASHSIKLWVDSGEMTMGTVCLDVDGTTHKLEMGERMGSAYIIRKEGGQVFLLYDADQASDDYVTCVYNLTEGTPVLTAQEYMEIVPGQVSGDRLQTLVRLDLLGTYGSSQEYELTEEGTLVRISENYPIANKFGYGVLTTKQPIPVVCNGVEKTLPAGTRLQLTGTDKEGIAWYRLVETGEEGEIHFEYTNEMRVFVTIGGKDEIECFEDLPYAG